jgi:hypothetical protein
MARRGISNTSENLAPAGLLNPSLMRGIGPALRGLPSYWDSSEIPTAAHR